MAQRSGCVARRVSELCLTLVLLAVILERMTRKTAISLPDDLYREIERARKRTKKDRSTWIQEAASEYLRKRTKEEEIEAWLSAYERVPLTEDELALQRWMDEHIGELFAEERPKKRGRPRARR